MKKRFLFLIVALCFVCIGFCIPTAKIAKAEEVLQGEGNETEQPEVTELPCKVILTTPQYGDVLFDKEEGNVGDIVTLTAKPYSFFKLESIVVNDTVLVADDKGNYSFALVEGDNVITAKFIVDSEEIEFVKQIVSEAKENNWKDIFSVKNLLTVISWVISLLVGGGFCLTLLKNKKVKSQTTADVLSTLTTAVDSTTGKAITDFLNDTFAPCFDKFGANLTDIEKICSTLARCMVLSQENTPEARLAIIQELSEASKKTETLSEEVKKIVQQEVEKNEKEKQAQMDLIKDLEAKNQALGEQIQVEDTSNGRY